LRTIEDLERYYEVEQGTEDSEKVRTVVQKVVRQEEENIQEGLLDVSILVALALRRDFAEK
jgi:hypothetical protein